MIKKMIPIFTIILLLAGCASQQPGNRQPDKKDGDGFSSSKYLTAKGIGQSEPEARKQALAELSNIFESKVYNDTYTHAKLVVDSSKGEHVNRRIESNIRVVSSVQLYSRAYALNS